VVRKAPISWHLSIQALKMMLVALGAWFRILRRIHAGRLVTASLGLKEEKSCHKVNVILI
jgi:hypothetical protein